LGRRVKSFSADQLTKGSISLKNLVRTRFPKRSTRWTTQWKKKQAYETAEIKQTFRSADARADMEATVAKAEQQREPLVAAIKAAFVPVTHTIKIVAE